MNAWLRTVIAGSMLAVLAACASMPAPAPASPSLRLSPASLGASLALLQQLTVTVAGRTQRVELILEADLQVVRLAVLSLGQTAARLEWDGARLTQTRAPWWPEAVTAERILDDLQLMLWPAQAVSEALPAGWSLASTEGLRVLSQQGQPVVQVRYEGPNTAELIHLRQGYRVRVESRAMDAAP